MPLVDPPRALAVPISNWHGTTAVRKLRPRCSLPPAEALGPAEEGMRYRTHGWLRTDEARRLLADSSGGSVLVPMAEMQREADASADLAATAIDGIVALAGLPVPAHVGPRLAIAANLPPSSLRAVVGNASLVSVRAVDVPKLLSCVEDRHESNKLLERLFRTSASSATCWRPEERPDLERMRAADPSGGDPETGEKLTKMVSWGRVFYCRVSATAQAPRQCER